MGKKNKQDNFDLLCLILTNFFDSKM